MRTAFTRRSIDCGAFSSILFLRRLIGKKVEETKELAIFLGCGTYGDELLGREKVTDCGGRGEWIGV